MVLSLLTGTVAFAGVADCGLGTQITDGNNSIVSQTVAYTTNGTSHITTVATQTSGCDYSGIVQKERLQEFYVAQTYANLEEEAAKGEGPYLSGLAELMDCAPQAHQAFGKLLQTHYMQLFAEDLPGIENGKILLKKIKERIRSKPELAAVCNVS